MTKKDIIKRYPAIAYISACGGLDIHFIEYGIEDYIYCISGVWYGKKRYHKLKVNYSNRSYIKLNGYKLYLDEALKK